MLNYTARQLYNTQDNLSAVVNFLSNSIAQLPLKVYKRTEENHRERDRVSPAALLLYRPNGDQTEYEFIRALAVEYFVFGCVYVWILPDADSQSGYQARIIPTDWVTSTEKSTNYGPDKITVSASGNQIEIPRAEFVRFCTYSPGNPAGYVSPISALRQTLEEQIQAGRFRKELWRSSGRLNAQIIRPKDVQPWGEEAKKRWIEAFREAWGPGGSKAGAIPLLEDGMEIKPFTTSFKEQQWAESIKLSREAVAAAYGINPSLVWHSDTQTYASSKDNARALYAECLGPVLQMLQQRINSFLLPMVG
ncbi:MAG: phage portal protein, partial [Clostridia bacterium]|nr:phage portal protein [Clostridia bacterium]